MLNILNQNEIGYISGGWICNNMHENKPFLKATWHRDMQTRTSFGTCYYGKIVEEITFYAAPNYLTGIVQELNTYWVSKGTTKLGYTLYECEASANNCVFK